MQERSLNDNFLSNLVALNNEKNSERIEFLLYDVLKLDTQSVKQQDQPSIIQRLLEVQQESEEYDGITGYNHINTYDTNDDQLSKRNPPIEKIPDLIYKFKQPTPKQHETSCYKVRNTPHTTTHTTTNKIIPDYHDELNTLFSQHNHYTSEHDYDSDSDSDSDSIPLLFMILHSTSPPPPPPKTSNSQTRKRYRNKLKMV
tara:strand:- start:565 stop:1164 length:600 start_codon:yes stop_codon:yes gene_type:complete